MRYLSSISLALIVLMALACTATPPSPTPTPYVPKYTDVEVYTIIANHLSTSDVYLCRTLLDRRKGLEIENTGAEEKYSMAVRVTIAGIFRWEFFGDTGVILSTSKRQEMSRRNYNC